MTYAEYSRIDAVNWSSLKVMAESPLAYLHAKMTPRPDSRHFRIGRAIHAHILEPHTFRDQFWLHKGSRRGTAFDLLQKQADAAGVTILTQPEWDAAFAAAAAVLANPTAAALLARGLKEAVMTWTDADTGLKCKARLDHAGAALIDLKSANRIERHAFASQAYRFGYHGQFAFYEDGLRANGIDPADLPHMIVVQSELPCDVIVYRMTPDVMTQGRLLYRRLLAQLRDCLATNTWPGMAPNGPIDFALPAYAGLDDEDDDDLDYGDQDEEGEAA